MKILILTLAFFFVPSAAFSAELPYIDGQDTFNSAVSGINDGSFSLSAEKIIRSCIDGFLSEVRQNAHYLILFFVVGALSALITLVEFNDNHSSNAAFFACYTMCAGIALNIMTNITKYASGVITSMTDFITKLSPILTSLLLTSGKASSAGAFHPVLAAAVYFMTLLIKKCIIPLAVYSSVLSVANNLNQQIQISSFCKLISSVAKWLMTAAFTIFTGICGIYGFSAPALDLLSAKTAKFAVGSLVPVVGRFLSETMETVVSAGTVMKNVVGSAGIFTLFSICLIPVLKIIVMLIFLRISAALTEPLTDKRISGLLSDMSETVTLILGMTLTVTVLFVICISIIVAATN